jgi:hypothetical protein
MDLASPRSEHIEMLDRSLQCKRDLANSTSALRGPFCLQASTLGSKLYRDVALPVGKCLEGGGMAGLGGAKKCKKLSQAKSKPAES